MRMRSTALQRDSAVCSPIERSETFGTASPSAVPSMQPNFAVPTVISSARQLKLSFTELWCPQTINIQQLAYRHHARAIYVAVSLPTFRVPARTSIGEFSSDFCQTTGVLPEALDLRDHLLF